MRGLLFLLLLGCPVLAQNWPVANCLAGVGDTTTTLLAIRSGASEANPVLRSSTGGVRVPVMIGLKALSCGMGIAGRKKPVVQKMTKIFTFVNLGLVVNNSTVLWRRR